jgi:crotonobetainyl-CoA:carnitine CoA-transferase CaiB-like acyl-CoA transferase
VGPGPAIKLSDADRGPLSPAPGLGEHTDEVLAAAGLAASEIDGLRTRGVV